jgi:2-polyprenyl-3-methyl-5-hydroxy-6-metoxy-1,4-benzoquinol methylase
MNNTQVVVNAQDEWGQVATDLEQEKIKLQSYDNVLLDLVRPKVLDFGAGPGVLATALASRGLLVKVYDISSEMLDKAAQKIGESNVIRKISDVPENYFDFVICNLVLCIVPDTEVQVILQDIYRALTYNGRALIGFCNPVLFETKESNLDFRFPTGEPYEKNHRYKKTKKEGGYEIIEDHRPMEWYENEFAKAGFRLLKTHFTPRYELNGVSIQDFVIFELMK